MAATSSSADTVEQRWDTANMCVAIFHVAHGRSMRKALSTILGSESLLKVGV